MRSTWLREGDARVFKSKLRGLSIPFTLSLSNTLKLSSAQYENATDVFHDSKKEQLGARRTTSTRRDDSGGYMMMVEGI